MHSNGIAVSTSGFSRPALRLRGWAGGDLGLRVGVVAGGGYRPIPEELATKIGFQRQLHDSPTQYTRFAAAGRPRPPLVEIGLMDYPK